MRKIYDRHQTTINTSGELCKRHRCQEVKMYLKKLSEMNSFQIEKLGNARRNDVYNYLGIQFEERL